MIRYARRLIVAICCNVFFTCLLQAGNLYPVSLQERSEKASLIVEGRVISQYSFWDYNKHNIYTSNLVKIYKIFKGNIRNDEIEIITEGGTVGMQRQELSSTLALKNDETGILFCIPHQIQGQLRNGMAGSYMVYSSLQGFIAYNMNDNTAADPFVRYVRIDIAASAVKAITGMEKMLSQNPGLVRANRGVQNRTAASPVISSFSPTIIPAGTGAVLTINGSGFGEKRGAGSVEFRNSDDGGASFIKALDIDSVLWTDTQIQVRVPSVSNAGGCSGTGVFRVTTNSSDSVTSPSTLTIPYAILNVTVDNGEIEKKIVSVGMPYLISHNGAGGYTFRLQTSFNSNIDARASFMRAFEEWGCPTPSFWVIGEPSTADDTGDGSINIISFEDLPIGMLARTRILESPCGTPGSLTWSVTGIDISFAAAPPVPWQFGPDFPAFDEYDFQSVALHELGHAQLLKHSINMGSPMYFSIANGRTLRGLSQNERDGAKTVIERSLIPDACIEQPISTKDCKLLPLELVSFSGRYVSNNGVTLAWKTTGEYDISGYRLQRSKDGINFSNISFVKSQMATQINNYEYIDKEIISGKCYYRLCILNQDGKEKFSDIIVFNLGSSSGSFAVYPNPAEDFVIISGSNIDLSRARFELFNIDGRKVQSLQYSERTNSFNKKISVRGLAAGLYFYVLQNGSGEMYKGKIIKLGK